MRRVVRALSLSDAPVTQDRGGWITLGDSFLTNPRLECIFCKKGRQAVQETTTCVIGGAASGKSAFAEQLTRDHHRRMTYLATSRVLDDEMREKVARHAARRDGDWRIVEEPMEPGTVLAALDARDVCLLDCATMWLTNHLLAGSDLDAAQARLLAALGATSAAVVVVTNEVGAGIVPDNALARRFRDAQGRLNIALAAQSDCVVQVVAGLPNLLKGQLP